MYFVLRPYLTLYRPVNIFVSTRTQSVRLVCSFHLTSDALLSSGLFRRERIRFVLNMYRPLSQMASSDWALTHGKQLHNREMETSVIGDFLTAKRHCCRMPDCRLMLLRGVGRCSGTSFRLGGARETGRSMRKPPKSDPLQSARLSDSAMWTAKIGIHYCFFSSSLLSAPSTPTPTSPWCF